MPLFNRGFGGFKQGIGPSQGFVQPTQPKGAAIGYSGFAQRKKQVPQMTGMMQQFRQPRIQFPGMGTAGMGGSLGGRRRY